MRIFNLFVFILLSNVIYSQDVIFDFIQISRIQHTYSNKTKTRSMATLNLATCEILFYKNPNKNSKTITNNTFCSFFKDSINYSQIKEIALNSITDQPDCIYYTEYGYYKIELIKMDSGISGSELYSESILIDNPYNCKDLVLQEKLNSILKQIREILKN